MFFENRQDILTLAEVTSTSFVCTGVGGKKHCQEKNTPQCFFPRKKTLGPRSAVVSASYFGSEDRGFESRQSHRRFSDFGQLQPRVGMLWALWEGWDHTAEFHPLQGCVFEGVALTA